MTKVEDVETADSSSNRGWATDLKSGGYFKSTSPGRMAADPKGKAKGGKEEEELKLLGSPLTPMDKPVIVSTSSPGGMGKGKNDLDLLPDHSNDATLTINGLSGLDDNDHGTTYTATMNSLNKFRNRFSSKYGRMRKRVVFKNGDTNLHQTNISKRRRKYLADLFITLVDLQVRFS